MILARRAMLWAALVGLFVSSYLLVVYVTGGPIVCGAVHGCDVVRASSWAKTVFDLPRPLLGVAFYAGFIGLLVWRNVYPHWRSRSVYHLSMLGVSIGLVESAFLTFVQAFEIKAYCLWCLASAVTATIMFIAAWWDKKDALEPHGALRELAFQFWSLVAAVVVGGIAILFLTIPFTEGERPTIVPAEISPEVETQTRGLLVRDGMTFEGPATATVTLIEFIDYQCPSCKLAHPEIAKVRDRFRGTIRFGLRNFPLPVHRQAAGAALAAVCADAQQRLFDMGDLMIANQNALLPADLVRYATTLKLDVTKFKACLDDATAKAIVERDLKDGAELGVRATPTFFVNTTMIEGLPSADQMSQLIDSALLP